MYFCNNCGAPLQEPYQFCGACGTKVDWEQINRIVALTQEEPETTLLEEVEFEADEAVVEATEEPAVEEEAATEEESVAEEVPVIEEEPVVEEDDAVPEEVEFEADEAVVEATEAPAVEEAPEVEEETYSEPVIPVMAPVDEPDQPINLAQVTPRYGYEYVDTKRIKEIKRKKVVAILMLVGMIGIIWGSVFDFAERGLWMSILARGDFYNRNLTHLGEALRYISLGQYLALIPAAVGCFMSRKWHRGSAIKGVGLMILSVTTVFFTLPIISTNNAALYIAYFYVDIFAAGMIIGLGIILFSIGAARGARGGGKVIPIQCAVRYPLMLMLDRLIRFTRAAGVYDYYGEDSNVIGFFQGAEVLTMITLALFTATGVLTFIKHRKVLKEQLSRETLL